MLGGKAPRLGLCGLQRLLMRNGEHGIELAADRFSERGAGARPLRRESRRGGIEGLGAYSRANYRETRRENVAVRRHRRRQQIPSASATATVHARRPPGRSCLRNAERVLVLPARYIGKRLVRLVRRQRHVQPSGCRRCAESDARATARLSIRARSQQPREPSRVRHRRGNTPAASARPATSPPPRRRHSRRSTTAESSESPACKMDPVASRLRLDPRDVDQQLRARITAEIESVIPDLRRHAAQPTAARRASSIRRRSCRARCAEDQAPLVRSWRG